MPTFGDSLKRYIRYVAQKWWQIAIGAVAAVIGVVTDVITTLRVPLSVWIGAGVVALVVAQFAAFRRLHVDLSIQLAEASSAIAEIEAEAQMPYQLARHPLSSSFDLHTFKSLEISQRGLVVRCIVGSAWTGDQLEIPGRLKTDLRDSMKTSSAERLLVDALHASSGGDWHLADPTHQWAVTAARHTDDLRDKDFELDAELLYQVPYPGSRRGWIATIFDIAVRSVDGFTSHIWDLRSFYDFVVGLIHATSEVHTRSVSHMTEEEIGVAGPVVAFSTHSSRLEDFVEYPQWDRAAGVSGTSYLTLDSHDENKVTSTRAQRAFLMSELRAHISREGFVGFEEELDQLLGSE